MIAGLAILAGVLAGLGAARDPAPAWTMAMAAGVALGASSPLRRVHAFRVLAVLAVGFLLALGAARHWSQLRLRSDTRVLADARILTVPTRAGTDVRFDAEIVVREGLVPADSRPRRARLAWREPVTVPRVGERWRLVLKLAPAAELRNFTGFDLERIAIRDRIHVSASVLSAALNVRTALANASIDSLRARVATRIADDVADPDAAALLTALAVGLTDAVTVDQWRVFNATGTTHLVAISGLHVTLFALLAFFCARRIWRFVRPLRWMERETFALFAGCAAAGGYALLAGFSVPAQRTWLMLGVFALAKLQARHAGAGRIWSLALITVLLLDPFAPLAAGFWLSFVAVGVILWTETTGLVPRRGNALRVQLAVTVALAPLTIAVFDSLSLAGLAVNLIAIPIVSFVLVPLVLAGAVATLWQPEWSTFFFGLAAALYHAVWPALVWVADSAVALARLTPPLWWCALALVAGVLVLKRWPAPLRFAGLALALPLCFAPARMPGPDAARITVLDAGRGSAALIVTRQHAFLFDTGDSWNTGGGRARQLVIPALDALGVGAVDLLVLPTLDPDRAAGAALLAHERGVARIVVGGGWPASTLPVEACDNRRFSWDGVVFTLFAAGMRRDRCVLRVSVGTHGLLIGGDLDAADERGLLQRLPHGALASDVVVMSHHASDLASSREWIEAGGATLALATGGTASSGSRERAIERWQRSGADILDTRRDGAIELDLGTQGIVVRRVARVDAYPFAWRRLP